MPKLHSYLIVVSALEYGVTYEFELLAILREETLISVTDVINERSLYLTLSLPPPLLLLLPLTIVLSPSLSTSVSLCLLFEWLLRV